MRVAFLCLAALAQFALNAAATSPITIPLFRRSEDGGIYKAAGKALDNGVVCLDFQHWKKKQRAKDNYALSFFLVSFSILITIFF